MTIFYSSGQALDIAGPGPTLLAYAVVGLVAICVMECVSELIQMSVSSSEPTERSDIVSDR